MDSRTLALVLSTLAELRNAKPQRSMARTIATEAVCLMVAVVAMTATIGCAAAALWNYALPLLGSTWTPLVVALAFLVICVIALLAMTQMLRQGRRRDPIVPGAIVPRFSLVICSSLRVIATIRTRRGEATPAPRLVRRAFWGRGHAAGAFPRSRL